MIAAFVGRNFGGCFAKLFVSHPQRTKSSRSKDERLTQEQLSTLPETNSLPPKNDAWKTILSFWDCKISGAMLTSECKY